MAARLGNVLYWTGCILALLALIVGTLTAVGDTADPVDYRWYLFALFGAGPALALWLVGRACRYVLAGR